MIGWLVNIPPNISPSFVGKYITIIHTCPMCEPMVLVYKNLQNWMILFGQMVINIPDMEHMGVAVGWTTRYAPVAVVLQLQEMKLVTHQSTTISLFNGLVCKNLNRKPSIFHEILATIMCNSCWWWRWSTWCQCGSQQPLYITEIRNQQTYIICR